MRRATVATTLAALLPACAHAPPPAPPQPVATTSMQPPSTAPAPPPALAWPPALAEAMKDRGDPHAPPLALPGDARGRERWLAFVGPPESAVAAWRVARAASGEVEVEPVARFPYGAKVLGGVVRGETAFILVESAAVLDQPAGLRGVWVDAGPRASAFDASPLALADVRDVAELEARVAHPPAAGAAERNAVSLLATLRAASASTAMLARSLAAEGADVGVAWQATFVQKLGRLDGEGSAPSPLADRVLGVVRAAVQTQACGADACEAWTDGGHAIVRFVVQGGRWVVRAVVEDAQPPKGGPAGAPHVVTAASSGASTDAALRARARRVEQVLGEAPLAAGGGTIGVALTDLTRDVPVVAVQEGGAARLLSIEAGTVRAEAAEAKWEAAFADVDGDGRTDVVVHMSGKRADGSAVTWTQAFLAPPPSVQATALEPDLVTALATMDAADAATGARAASAPGGAAPSKDEACRLLATASTVAGFQKVTAPDARVLRFDEPGMPTWRPRVVRAPKIAADDVRGLGAHCAELVCSATRPYCAWAAGADSMHAWFAWQGGQLVLAGAADYTGE